MPELFLALEGRVDFLKKTNPFGGTPEKRPVSAEELHRGQALLDNLTQKARAKARKGKVKRD